MRRRRHFLLSAALVLILGRCALADTLVAADVIHSTNIEWIAFMRAQKSVREGKSVDFVWPDHPAASYAEIRRALWLAALHGIRRQTGRDQLTRRLMEPELRLTEVRLMEPFAYDVAVRDGGRSGPFASLLVAEQVGTLLIGASDPSPLKLTFLCQPEGVSVEGSEVILPSPAFAANYAQSSHTDAQLVFETDGSAASNLFVRRFKDGSATVVNLTDSMRRNLTYRHGFNRFTFDLHPADVIHLLGYDPPRLTRPSGERFISDLWQITFGGNQTPRVVDAKEVMTAVPEAYRGTVRYQTTACIPTGSKTFFLSVSTGNAATEVLIDGKTLGVRAWEPFEWAIPGICRGRNMPIEIRIAKRTARDSLLALPNWRIR